MTRVQYIYFLKICIDDFILFVFVVLQAFGDFELKTEERTKRAIISTPEVKKKTKNVENRFNIARQFLLFVDISS